VYLTVSRRFNICTSTGCAKNWTV